MMIWVDVEKVRSTDARRSCSRSANNNTQSQKTSPVGSNRPDELQGGDADGGEDPHGDDHVRVDPECGFLLRVEIPDQTGGRLETAAFLLLCHQNALSRLDIFERLGICGRVSGEHPIDPHQVAPSRSFAGRPAGPAPHEPLKKRTRLARPVEPAMPQQPQKRRLMDESPTLESHTRRVDHEEPLTVLARLGGQARFACFSSEATLVAAGTLVRLAADGPGRLQLLRGQARGLWQTLHHRADGDVPAEVGPLLMGGFSFHNETPPAAPWSAFPGALFVLPERLWTWVDGALYETTTATTAASQKVARDPVRRPASHPGEPEDASKATETDREAWEKSVTQILRRIRVGDVTKVVLARAKRFPAVDPVRLLDALPTDPGTHRFLFEPEPGHAFVGATPELLVRVAGGQAETVALAGTAARGEDSMQDSVCARGLVESPKDNLEHGLTVTWLDERLAAAGAVQVAHAKRRLRRLGHVQHLETPITAQLPPGVHVLDIAQELHPTPAVGGVPPREALGLIAKLETTPRGWYAGGVGYFGPSGEGTLLTAIRSALVTTKGLWAYAGAGIVAGSDPTAEWEETRLKMRLMAQTARAVDGSP